MQDYGTVNIVHSTITSKAIMPSGEVKAVMEERKARTYYARPAAARVAHSASEEKTVK